MSTNSLDWMIYLNGRVRVRRLPTYEIPLTQPITAGGRIITGAGEIAQILNATDIRFIAYVEFNYPSDVLRGNHYHNVREEYLYIITGGLHAVYEDSTTGEQVDLSLAAGDLVHVQPGSAHVYMPLEYSQSLEFSPNAYDPSDTQTYVITRKGKSSK